MFRLLLFSVLLVLASCAHGLDSGGSALDRATGVGAGASGVEAASYRPEPKTEELSPALKYAHSRYSRRIGVVIGINQYQAFPRLTAAVSDADRIGSLLDELGYDHVEYLRDGAATRAAIIDLMERRVPLIASDDDLVTVFFAGHGMTSAGMGYILPVDAKRNARQTAISVQRLKESALRMRARHVLYLMDACFSGTMFRKSVAIDETNSLAFWEAASKQRVVQLMTAGNADEMVLESGGWGSFTRSVHDGLQGKADLNRDQVVTSDELAQYVERRVVDDTGGQQHPLWGNIDGTGTVLLWDRRRLPAEAEDSRSAARAMIRGMEKELRHVHELMFRKEWTAAERIVRDLTLRHSDVELNLLLAEIYLESDALGNAALIDAELGRAAGKSPSTEEQRRLLDLRARLEKRKRAPY